MKQIQLQWNSTGMKPEDFLEGDILITNDGTYEIVGGLESKDGTVVQVIGHNFVTHEFEVIRVTFDDESCVIVRRKK